MMKIILGIIGAAVLLVIGYMLWVYGPAADEEVRTVREETLVCADGTEIGTAFLENENIIVTLRGVPYELEPAVSASGARYANDDESFVFWNNGDESMILVDGEVAYEECRVPGTEAPEDEDEGAATSSVADLIRNVSVESDDVIESPLVIEGEARGQWYFEATFPVVLTNWDGLIIAEGYAEAQDDWMTTEFVPFTATLEFESPYTEGDPDFMKRGSLILQKANASGLPEHDAAYEMTVYFAE